MYARRLKCRSQNWDSLYRQAGCLFRLIRRDVSQSSSCRSISRIDQLLKDSVVRKFNSVPFSLLGGSELSICRRYSTSFSYASHRFYSSKGDESNASGDKHVPIKDATNFDKGKSRKEEVFADSNHCNEHARLGELDQQEWLDGERLSVASKRRESPFLTKRQRFKNEFLRRVIPWEKITVSWRSFPYYIHEHSKNLLVECASSHLKHKSFTSSYGSRLTSSTGRILLQSIPGTELYRERLVRALARELQVPLLVLDSSVLAPYVFGQEYASESETDDDNAESGEECSSESDVEADASNEEEWASSNEAKSGESDDDVDDVQASAEALKKLVPDSLEEFAKRVSGEVEDTSSSMQLETAESSQQPKRPLKKDEFYGENHRGFQQDPNGQYGYNPGQIYQNVSLHNREGSRGAIPNNIQGFYGERAGDIHQRPYGHYSERPVDFQQSPMGYQAMKPIKPQQNPASFHGGIGYSHPMSGPPVGDALPTSESFETGDSSGYKGTIDELDEFCKEGKVKEAVEVLSLLEKNGVIVDLHRYLHLIHACGEARSLEEARLVHGHISRTMIHVEVGVNNKILDIYSKCGSMADAYQLFENMPQRNLTSWDTMIMGLLDNGLGEDAVDLFTEFKQTGLKPDGQMFVTIVVACGVLGAVDEGMLHFESMQKDFGISPGMEHYVSIVNMLGSTGYLDEALEFIEQMPIEPSVEVWETLMNLCRVHGNVELGNRCAEIVEQLDSTQLNEQSKIGLLPVKASDLAKEKERKKANLLEVRSRVHEYRAGDRSHPEHERIYAQIKGLAPQMKEAGYVPETRFVLHDIDQESKEEALLYHSERLAVAYGLMTSPARSPIRIIKNLRVCGDCHNAMKIISKLVGRQLIARDAKRFHHFENGVCSCKDYW